MTEDVEGYIWTGRRDERGNVEIVWKMPIKEARERAREERRRSEQRFREAPFPLYGLAPSWGGDRFLGGGEWGSDGGRTRTKALSLVHGTNIQGRGAMLVVETATERVTGGGPLETIAGMLRSGHVPDVRAAIHDLDGRGWRGEIDASRVTSGERTFLADADPVNFNLLSYEEEWVAWAQVGSLFVTVTGNPFDPGDVELVRVADIQPYVEGSRRFHGNG